MSGKKIKRKPWRPPYANDPDGTYEVDIDMPSGNQVHAVLSVIDGRMVAHCQFTREPSKEEAQSINGLMQKCFLAMFGRTATPTFVQSDNPTVTAQVRDSLFPEAKN